jgi:hypothetical protein
MKYELKNRRVICDTETNGFLENVTKMHCAVMIDIDTGELMDFGPDELDEFLLHYQKAKLVVGHNFIKYDYEVIRKLFGVTIKRERVRDTLILARLYNSDIKGQDLPKASAWKKWKLAAAEAESKGVPYHVKPPKEFPGQLCGSHSLEAWGYRLGEEKKGDYAKEMKAKGLDPWASWNPEMHEYMIQDAKVNLGLWLFLMDQELSYQAIVLEHRVAWLASRIEQNGFSFDFKAAEQLHMDLVAERNAIRKDLHNLFPPWTERVEDFIPARDNKTKGYVKGVPVPRYETYTFNPSSREHIANRIIFKYGWKPKQKTEGGGVKIDDEVLTNLAKVKNKDGTPKIPEAAILARSFVLDKRIGQLADGSNAWLKLYNPKTGCIHGTYNTNGAQTGRMTHAKPNVAQTPSLKNAKGVVPLGKEMRALWKVLKKGWKQIGADQAGLELRCLASFLSAFDGGEYARLISSPGFDTHWHHAKMLFNLPMDTPYDEKNEQYVFYRTRAKRYVYAYLYGAQDPMLASIMECTVAEAAACRKNFEKNFPALKKLIEAVQKASKKKWIKGLDGRRVPVRSAHAALNTLLQSAGALLCKQWMVDACDALTGERWEEEEPVDFVVNTWDPNLAADLVYGWDGDFVFQALVHDEIQSAAKEEHVPTVTTVLVAVARTAGNAFKSWRCPTDGDAKVGQSWADCH